MISLVSTAGEASAQPPPAPDSEAAKLHYERATAAYALGNFSEAALSYEKAFELKPDPALLYNAAQAHRRAGSRPRAIELYRSFLQVFPRAEHRELAERHLQELERGGEPQPANGAEGAAGTPPVADKEPGAGADARVAGAPRSLPVPAPVAAAGPATSAGLLALPSRAPAEMTVAPRRHELWRKRWVWIAVGAGALVTGTVAAFALSGRDDPQPSWGRVGP